MKSSYHITMTRNALEGIFSKKALKTIVMANLWQDRPRNQFGRDFIHFDGSAFAAGYAYISRQKQVIIEHLQHGNINAARKAFGKITHTWQDFYSHSNYVKLWSRSNPDASPDNIDPSDPDILSSPELFSGVNYGLIEFISMLPLFDKWIIPRMPADSHAKNHMDSPDAHPLFPFAISAAQKRTGLLWQEMLADFQEVHLPQLTINQFLGKGNDN